MNNIKSNLSYVVAGFKSWNRGIFDELIRKLPGNWHYVDRPENLTQDWLERIKPRYIFFLHWSWIVPDEIIKRYECVCFHMTDVPYGRGGSPLQNLIIQGHRDTKISAIRMVRKLDAGPVYLKRSLSLAGNAEQIYIRATRISAQMIEWIIRKEPKPKPQFGKIVEFRRRKPSESRIPKLPSIEAVYDFIRMLDAEGYPRAFIIHGGYRYEFRRACLYNERIIADVEITKIKGKEL